MTESPSPNFAALLGPYIAQVPTDAVPRFLALLERGAAERYREWAHEIPEHVEVLLACAVREDSIADRVERIWALDDSIREQLLGLLPQARTTYYEVFAGLSPWQQLAIQADAELQGAAAWRGIAANLSDPQIIAELERCSQLEEESARELHRIITRRVASPG